MTSFANQTIGSFDGGDAQTHEWVEIWWDESLVTGFAFHSVGMRDVGGRYHRVHGMTVEARYVWAAIHAFSESQLMGIAPEGHKFGVTWILREDQRTEELRMGDKWGTPIARMRRTGYVQQPRKGEAA